MNNGAKKSPLQIAALAVMFGGLVLGIALAASKPELLEPPVGSILLFVVLAALILHTLGMLINAIQHKHTGWAVGIFVLGPLASILYFVTQYDARDQTISTIG